VLERSAVGKVAGPGKRQHSQTPFLRRAGIYFGVAFELTGTLVGGPLVGYFLDNYLGTSPWFLVGLTIIAFIGAFMRLMQWIKLFARHGDGTGGKKDHTAD
jgi:F0F1-type ATP synthase assembly protein I